MKNLGVKQESHLGVVLRWSRFNIWEDLFVLICHFRLFTRLVLEAPKITPSALEIIKSYCNDEVPTHRQKE